MPENKLHIVFVALIISRISYALSAWGGFLNNQQINRINAFLQKARRFGICNHSLLIDFDSSYVLRFRLKNTSFLSLQHRILSLVTR